jgi:hypothetical protein
MPSRLKILFHLLAIGCLAKFNALGSGKHYLLTAGSYIALDNAYTRITQPISISVWVKAQATSFSA